MRQTIRIRPRSSSSPGRRHTPQCLPGCCAVCQRWHRAFRPGSRLGRPHTLHFSRLAQPRASVLVPRFPIACNAQLRAPRAKCMQGFCRPALLHGRCTEVAPGVLFLASSAHPMHSRHPPSPRPRSGPPAGFAHNLYPWHAWRCRCRRQPSLRARRP